MGNDKKICVAASVILLAAGFLWYFFHESPPSPDPRPHEALGRVMAEETLKLLGAGGKIILIDRDTSLFKNPATDLHLRSFYHTLRAAGHTAAVTNLIKANPIGLMTVPPGDFIETMRKAAPADVIVSFLGPPLATPNQATRLGNKRPTVIAFCSGSLAHRSELKSCFEQKLLSEAIVDRDLPLPPPSHSNASREWFDYWCQIITPANVSELPTSARP